MRNGEYDGYGQYMYGTPNPESTDMQEPAQNGSRTRAPLPNERYFTSSPLQRQVNGDRSLDMNNQTGRAIKNPYISSNETRNSYVSTNDTQSNYTGQGSTRNCGVPQGSVQSNSNNVQQANTVNNCPPQSSVQNACVPQSNIQSNCTPQSSIQSNCGPQNNVPSNYTPQSSTQNNCPSQNSIQNNCGQQSNTQNNYIPQDSTQNSRISQNSVQNNCVPQNSIQSDCGSQANIQNPCATQSSLQNSYAPQTGISNNSSYGSQGTIRSDCVPQNGTASNALIEQQSQFQCIAPAFFNAVYNGGAQDVPCDGEVTFLLSYQSGDFQFIPNSTAITVTIPGVYRIDYSLTLRPTIGQVNAVYAILINGEPHPFSFFGTYCDGMGEQELITLRGSFLTDLLADEVVTLCNKSNTCNHLTSATPCSQSINRAAIMIQRVA
ncbi:MAG: hypothetical protein LBM69_06915 [Lachnospiraceae bacterium]|nr:hypothetical protein [Lachnospiraceae bacterium]